VTIRHMNLRITEANPGDLPTIVELVRKLADYEKLSSAMVATEQDLSRALFGSERRARALLAFASDVPAGFAVYFYTFSTFVGKPGIYLEDIFVEPEYRGKGIGRALLRRIAQIARDEDCGRVEWSVLTWNQPSIDFYHRLGAVALEDWRMFRLTGDAIAALVQGE
jgi:GNAT superfamily N-acetyltransferase